MVTPQALQSVYRQAHAYPLTDEYKHTGEVGVNL